MGEMRSMAKKEVRSGAARLMAVLGAAMLLFSGVGETCASEIEGEDAGQRLYLTYCAACHGTSGKGDGTLAALLELKPTDLTGFSTAHGGIFPFRSVLRAIDGRMTVRAHGDAAMPVWGKVFAPQPGANMRQQLEAYGRLFLITFYVESLQQAGD